MKTRKLEFNVSLKIPQWWPYGYQLRALWKTLLYKLKPDHCHVCNARVDFRGSEFEGTSHGKRIMLSQHAKQPICGSCLARKIAQYYIQASLFVDKCDCCGEQKRITSGIVDMNSMLNLSEHEYNANKAVASALELDVRYGMHWWNGFKICEQCVVESIHNGRAVSSRSIFWGKTCYSINHRGAMIKK